MKLYLHVDRSERLQTDDIIQPIWECLLSLPVEIGKEILVNPLEI